MSNDDKHVTDSVQSNERQPLTFQKWQSIRRTNPKQYYTPRVQQLLKNDAIQLGDKFYDERPKEEWE